MAYGYGEDEDLPSINHSTAAKGRYRILNGCEYNNEEPLSYSKIKLQRIKETRNEESLNKMKPKKKQMSPTYEGSMSNGTPDLPDQLFACKHCNRSFGSKRMLQNHEDTHTDVNPFECKECHKGFTRNHHLKKHMRRHSCEKLYHSNRSQDSASKCNNNNDSFGDTSFQSMNYKLKDNCSGNTIKHDEAKKSVGNTLEENITESGFENNNQIKSSAKIKDCVTLNDKKQLDNCSYSQNNSSKCNKSADHEKKYKKKSNNDLSENFDHDLPDLPKSIYNTSLQNNSKINSKDKVTTSCNLEYSKMCNTNLFITSLQNKFICKLCKNTFRTKELLNEHMDVHRSKKYDCSKCGQQFAKLFEVAIHMHMHAHREKWESPKINSEKKIR